MPVELFFPEQMSAALRLKDFEAAWMRQWKNHPATDADAVLQELMVALDEWPRWVKKKGEDGAKERLANYKSTFMSLVGQEAWLVFGQWPATTEHAASTAELKSNNPKATQQANADGRVGLVILLRGDTTLARRVAPFVGLLYDEPDMDQPDATPTPDPKNRNKKSTEKKPKPKSYTITKSTYHGVALYAYEDRKKKNCITFCQIGGWIAASWKQTGEGPIPAIIDRLQRAKEAAPVPRTSSPQIWLNDDPFQPPAIAAVAYPQLFWGQLRQFNFQSGIALTKAGEQSLSRWQQRLDGIDRMDEMQVGKELLGLRATVSGPRPSLLQGLINPAGEASPYVATMTANRTATTTAVTTMTKTITNAIAKPTSSTTMLATAPLAELTAPTGAAGALAAQVDVSMTLAQSLAPLAGFDWNDLIEGLKGVETLVPGIRATLRPSLLGPADPAQHGRLGLALFRSAVPLFPKVLYWVDRAPFLTSQISPALAWAAPAVDDQMTSGDTRTWLASKADFASPAPAATGNKVVAAPNSAMSAAAGAELWQMAPYPPGAFATIYFSPLLYEMQGVPTILLKSNTKKQIAQLQSYLHLLNLTCGAGLGMRLDLTPSQWILQTRPLEQ